MRSLPDPFEGKEKQTEIVGHRLLEHAFVQTGSMAAQICQTNTTLLDSVAQTKEKSGKRFEYDQYDNVTNVYEYGFGGRAGIQPRAVSAEPAGLLRLYNTCAASAGS